MTIAISYPFTLDGFGKIVTADQYTKVYLDRVLTLLSTNIRQRPILQTYGSDVGSISFESNNELEASISNIITSAISTWLPDIAVNKVTVGLPDENGIADITLIVKLPNGNVSSVALTTATFNYDGGVTR